MHSTPTAAKAQPAKPTQAAVCVSAYVVTKCSHTLAFCDNGQDLRREALAPHRTSDNNGPTPLS